MLSVYAALTYPWQALEPEEQLFAYLRKMRKEVLFIRFPDESHELSRSGRPRHRLERFQHLLDWFEKYLTPEGVPARAAAAAGSSAGS